jgi:cytoskeletal protein CcmA (bactofilin family)
MGPSRSAWVRTGSVESVNGEFTLSDGAEILGSLSNVNGTITLDAARVGGGIKTVNGNISIKGASHVDGGLLVEKSSGELMQLVREVPRIVIGPGATVQGELRFERTVKLYVSDKATIGAVTGATAIPFTGDVPPN